MKRNIFTAATTWASLLAAANGFPAIPRQVPCNLTYIGIEEHYSTPASLASSNSIIFKLLAQIYPESVLDMTGDITQWRLPAMNQYGFRMQVRFFLFSQPLSLHFK